MRGYLENIRQRDLISQRQLLAEAEFQFNQITTHEVIYESLAYTARARLHEAIGHFIENHYHDQRSQYVHILAFHFGQTQNQEKQRLYYQQAGLLSQKAYANEAALDYYEKLLPLLPHHEQGALWLEIGKIKQHVGAWDEAQNAF